MSTYNHEGDDPPHAQAQRSNNDNQALTRQNQDTRASYEHLHPSYNPSPYASLERTPTPVLNSSQSQMLQGQVFNPVQVQMMPPTEGNDSLSPGFGMMPQSQPGGFNSNTFGVPSNVDANNYLRTLHGPNTYQQTYENLAASKWVQQQERQRRVQALFEAQFKPSAVNFNPFQPRNPQVGGVSQSQSSSVVTSPSSGIPPKSTPGKLSPLLSERIKDNSRPSPGPAPHAAQHGYVYKSPYSNNIAMHSRAAFEGPGGALSRNVNASFDTSVVDLTRPDDSPTWKVMEDIKMINAARKREKEKHMLQDRNDEDDDDVDMAQATSDEDKPTPAQHRSNEDTSTTVPPFPISNIVTTLPGSQPVQATTNDAADPVPGHDATTEADSDTDTDIDDATTVRDPSPDLVIRRAGPPSPPGRYPLPTNREIRRASRYVLWTQRESAAMAHVMDWARVVFGGAPLDDARWELLSKRLATHYNILRPAAVIRERWEKFLREDYQHGVKFMPYPEFLRNLKRKWETMRQENEENEDQDISYNGIAATGDKRKRLDSLSTSFDDDDTDDDESSGPSTPSPFHVFPANPNAPAPSSPQTFPRPASKLRRVTLAEDLSSSFSAVTTKKVSQTKPKRKKAPSKHVVALARAQFSLPHAFSAARDAVAHLRTASAHSVRGSFDTSPGSTFTLGGGSYSSATGGDPKDVMRLRVVGQKVLDTFAAKTGGALPGNAKEILRKAVGEFAGVMGREREKSGDGGGADDGMSVEEMDVDAEDEADMGEMRVQWEALKERLQAQCVGVGVSFVWKEQEDYSDDEEEHGAVDDGEVGDKPGAEADGAAVEEAVGEAGGEPGEEGDGSSALV
ncbi:hypothetical protein DBV05_g8379 [Lasiodiplodia theobromae]|uniref:Myb-like domain-containing protein n=1 Tax=Lasiodiplodia theobromae TaxID=45133 RepID=A0A5N5D6J8_9PEZI|nr:hypothetical protein DBV05_g8379 [Lasiodiplodia theobromae]